MKKIVLLPLDERPCTYDYPNMLASMANDVEIIEAQKDIMGDVKRPGNISKINEFLKKECSNADYAIIAIDTLLYGGIVPSRLHYEDEETLLKRLSVLKEIKEINPNIQLYAYHLIMRCPTYSGDSEEPSYYALCGREIHLIGKYQHLETVRELNESEKSEYNAALKFIKENNYQNYLDDYIYRRKINTAMNIYSLDLAKNNVIDFLIIPQDDSAPYGFTALDQIKVRKAISDNGIEFKALMYPDADAVSNTLLARCLNKINCKVPQVFVKYSTCNEGKIIPNYEDRPVSETIKYQILAAGGMETKSENSADIFLMVNVPYDNMIEARHLYDSLTYPPYSGETSLNYTSFRNLIEYVEYIKYLISENKNVCVADIAYSNGGDIILFNLLKNENILFKINSYAGWNTSSNTLGTCIPLAMINKIYGPSQNFLKFMGLRYLEDVGYMSNVRFKAFDHFKNKYSWGLIDGKEDGEVAKYIKQNLIEWSENNLNQEYKVQITEYSQPWNRFFETNLKVNVEKVK